MLSFPDLDPIAFQIGSWSVRWYGLMYLAGFAAFWGLARLRVREPWRHWKPAEVDDLLFYGALGVILGGRIGYIIFYDFSYTLSNPWNIFKVWQGGMSFHGGLLGVMVATWLFARSTGRSFFQVTDFIVPLIPPGLGFGRFGNFLNNELWGKTSDLPWAIIPRGSELARHPSQLYEALLEGVVLFLMLWFFSRRPRPVMAISGLFLLGYGAFRFAVEFVRVPDQHLDYLAFGWVTMGQVLTVPMIAAGVGLIGWAYTRASSDEAEPQANTGTGKTKRRSRRVRRS